MNKSSINATNGAGSARPTHDEIAALAFNLYLDRGCQPGHEKDDWFCAEQLLIGQIGLETASRHALASETGPQPQRSRRTVRSL